MIKKITFILILTLSVINPVFTAESETLWGISKTDLINRLKLESYSTFKPSEKPEYSNRIIDFFNSMASDQKFDITILRTGEKPEVDYCFFNEKLYSISEDWGNIEIIKAGEILKSLKAKYTEVSTENKDQHVVYSFKKDKTKIVLYKKTESDKSVNIKIFYYSTTLFSMLLAQ